MKQGRTLEQLVDELTRQVRTKKDYLVPSQGTEMVVSNADTYLDFGNAHVGINKNAHDQISAHTGIPRAYYEKMRTEAPGLLASNVNEWFRKYPAVRMVRTLDSNARAYLSDRYRALDNFDLAEAALPPLMKLGVKILSCDVTDTKLYLKVVDQRVARKIEAKGVELGRGHTHFHELCPALVLSNSEVGAGALALKTSVWEEGCTNLMVIKERSTRKHHVGSKHELLGEDTYAMLSDRTKKLTDAALWAQVGDVVKAAFERAQFDAICDKLEATTGNPIEGDPVKVIEIAAEKYGMNDVERGSVLKHLIRSGELTQYGLQAAITRTAEDVESYDRASELEEIGGKVIELPRHEWKEIALAA